MRDLILNGVDADGTHLLLTDESGQQYQLPVDEALYAAVRKDRNSPRSDGPVRPRDIQAMIRGGMSADEVISTTGADVEQVRTYERPALAERAHMAHRASRYPIYSDHDPNGDPTPLVELCQTRLALRDVDIETMDWDAWKRQDGHWYIQLSFTAADRTRTAGWDFYRNSLKPLDDEATWLADSGPTDTGPIPGYPTSADRRVTTEEIISEPIVDSDVHERDHQAETGRILENLRRRRRHDDEEEPRTRLRAVTEDPETHPQGAHTAPGQPAAADDDEIFALEEEESEPTLEVGNFDDDDQQLSLLNEPGVSEDADSYRESESKSKKKNSRSSVPSWDEIMFGSKRD